MKQEKLDTKGLYRLPWSKNDNPNGWVEITTFCNMKCPGCYRGCDRKSNKEEHKSLEKIKEEILLLKKIRNCDTISISGGEPLMHPNILDIVKFIRINKMNPVIFTNGSLINKEILINLKKAGLVGILIRVDSLRETNQTETELNGLRQKYADLVYSIKGINMGFTCCMSKKNIIEIPEVIKWVQKNNNKVDILVLIFMRPVVFNKKDKIVSREYASINDLYEIIEKEIPLLKYNAYLGSELEDLNVKWLLSVWFSLEGKFLGSIDNKAIEFIQMYYHLKNEKYSYILNKNLHFFSFFKLLFGSLTNKSIRKIFKNYLIAKLRNPSLLFKKAHFQILNIVTPPGFVEGKRDMCDSCPDATLYNGKLYPSCGLEEIKKFGRAFEFKYGQNL